VDDLRAVDKLAFANTRANGEQQDDRASGAAEAEAIPRELEAGHRGLCRLTIQPRGPADVAEARRIAIHNLLTLQGCAYHVVDRNGVRDELAASDVGQRRRFSDRECTRELRVERNVVVVDLARLRYSCAVQG